MVGAIIEMAETCLMSGDAIMALACGPASDLLIEGIGQFTRVITEIFELFFGPSGYITQLTY